MVLALAFCPIAIAQSWDLGARLADVPADAGAGRMDADLRRVEHGDAENIASDLPGGLTALASISAVSDPSVASSKPRLPLAQRPYYRVLIKGEQLKPKAGRADDFSWPRS